MSKKFLLAIDIGTQTTRAALVDLEGRVVHNSSESLALQTPRPGWAEQDPDAWWATTLRNLHGLLGEQGVDPRNILAVGVSGQMHGTVPIGANGDLLSHGVQLWCDKRASDIVEGFAARTEAEAARMIAGTPPAAAWFGFKIKWLQINEPGLYRRTWKFLVPKDFINFRLTGVPAIDPSEASGSFLMDARRISWSAETCKAMELDLDKLPSIRASEAVVGAVTAEAAKQTGLAEGTPVVTGGGDMLCALLAAGLTERGRACDITGTSSHLSIYQDAPADDRRLMNLHHVVPGWVSFGIIDSSGGALKWFKDTLCQEEIDLGERTGRSPYSYIDEYALAVEPGSEGLLFFPYMFGERILGTPYARGVFFGLLQRHAKGALGRSIMEGVTFELKRTLEIVEACGTLVEEIRTTGGGAQSALWSQIKADIYGKPVVTFEIFEGSILGAAILAGVGVGVYPDARSASERLVHLGKVFLPNPDTRARYDSLFALFKEVHEALQAPFNRYREMPLGRGGGTCRTSL